MDSTREMPTRRAPPDSRPDNDSKDDHHNSCYISIM